MKKYTLLILTLFICCNSFAQFKIGNITLDSETFKDYIADCYLHPDTVKDINPYDRMCYGCYIDINAQHEKERQAKEFNNGLRKNNIGLVTDTVYYPAGIDTIWFVAAEGSSKTFQILSHEAGYYVNYNGFLMPRKPSEQDFVKWFNKNQIQ